MREYLNNSDAQLEAPQGLRDDLASLLRLPDARRVDGKIQGSATRHFRRTAGAARILLRLTSTAAAAAVLLTAISLPTWHSASPAATESLAASADINGDGRIDIRDALLLARRIEDRGALSPRWDFTGDRVVDRADVDAIAFAAVRLDRRHVQ